MFVAAALFLSVILAYGLYSYFHNERGWLFSPISFSWFGFSIFMIVVMFNFSYMKYQRDAYAAQCCFLFCLAGIAYITGLHVYPRRKFDKIASKFLVVRRLPSFWLFSGACVFFALASVLPRGTEDKFVSCILQYGATTIAVAFSLIFLRDGSRKNAFTTPLKFICAVIIIYIMVDLYLNRFSRRPLLGIIIAETGFVYESFFIRKKTSEKAIFLLTIVAFAFVVQLSQRNTRIYDPLKEKQATSLADRFSGEVKLNQFSDADLGFIVCRETVKTFQKERDFRLGATYAGGFLFFIPRAFWPDKPETAGQIATKLMRFTHEVNVSPTPVGEAYINGGFFAIIPVFFVAGWLVRLLETFVTQRRGNPFVLLFWLQTAPDLLTQWRGDFSSMYSHGMMKIMLGVAILTIIAFARPSTPSPAPEEIAPEPAPDFPFEPNGEPIDGNYNRYYRD